MIFRCGNRGRPEVISRSIPRANTIDERVVRESKRQQRGGQFSGLGSDPWADSAWLECADGKARRVPQSGFRELDDGLPARLDGPGLLTVGKVPHRIDRLRALGNAIVPQVAARFFHAMRLADEI